MFANNTFRRTLSLLVITGAISVVAQPVFAAPPATPNEAETMGFSTTVDKECALQVAAAGTATAYTPSYASLGTPAEDRVLKLAGSDSVTFDCNSDTISIQVALTTLTEPSLTNATALNGFTHDVSWTLTPDVKAATGTASHAMLDGEDNGSAQGDLLAATVMNSNADGDIQVAIGSQFYTTAEELPEGEYTTLFTVTAIAQ
jgi:hypothetical protein